MAAEVALPALIGSDPAKFAAVENKTGIFDTGRFPVVSLAVSNTNLALSGMGRSCGSRVTTTREL